jgi:WD40 repeat protein
MILASGSSDTTIKLWDPDSGELLHSLPGHTNRVEAVAFSGDGRLLASKCRAGTIHVWSCETWETVAIIPEPTYSKWWIPALAFHPTLSLLATAGSAPGTPEALRSRVVHLWKVDINVLLSNHVSKPVSQDAISSDVLTGDTNVGQSGVGVPANRPATPANDLNIGAECLDL